MARVELYLELGEEFGGTPFGPLAAEEVRIGTGPTVQIRVAVGLGVAPIHARLVPQARDGWLLAPVERESEIWVIRAGQRGASPLLGPVELAAGDAFCLASPHGVRFHLVQRTAQRAPRRGGPGAPGGGGLTGAALAGEVLRRVRAAILTTWFGRMVQNGWTFVRTGQLLSPVYIIGLLTMMSGWGYGFTQCSALRAKQHEVKELNAMLDVSAQVAGAGSTGLASISRERLIGEVIGLTSAPMALDWSELDEALALQLKVLFTAGDNLVLPWFADKGTPYGQAVTFLERAGLPREQAAFFAWMAVEPTLNTASMKAELLPEPKEVVRLAVGGDGTYRSCQVGLFRLTWRQANALGLDAWLDAVPDDQQAANLDAFIDAQKLQILSMLSQTRISAGLPSLPPTDTPIGPSTLQWSRRDRGGNCVFYRTPGVEQDLRRNDFRAAEALMKVIGPDAPGVPAMEATNGVIGRLARLYAMDLREGAGDTVRVTQVGLGAGFDAVRATDKPGVTWVATRTAEHLARAVAIPCLIVLERIEAKSFMGRQSSDIFNACAVLEAQAQHNR